MDAVPVRVGYRGIISSQSFNCTGGGNSDDFTLKFTAPIEGEKYVVGGINKMTVLLAHSGSIIFVIAGDHF